MAETPVFVDTSIIVRYLTDDPPDLARRAEELLESSDPVSLSELVLVETAYVLTSVNGIPRTRVVDAITWAQARHAEAARILTLDRRFPDEELELVGVRG